jgi:hypothetical protein
MHEFGDGDGEVAGGLPMLYECVFDGGLRASGEGENEEECDANL